MSRRLSPRAGRLLLGWYRFVMWAGIAGTAFLTVLLVRDFTWHRLGVAAQTAAVWFLMRTHLPRVRTMVQERTGGAVPAPPVPKEGNGRPEGLLRRFVRSIWPPQEPT